MQQEKTNVRCVRYDKEVPSLIWHLICWFRIIYNFWLSEGLKALVKKAQIKFGGLDFAFIRLDEISLFLSKLWHLYVRQTDDMFSLDVLITFHSNLITLVRDLLTKYRLWSSFRRRKCKVFKYSCKHLKSYELTETYF